MRPLLKAGHGVFGLLLAAGLVAAFVAVLAIVGDMREAAALLRGLTWRPVALLVALGILDHAVRYARWELVLRRVWGREIRRSTNVAIYLLGSLLIFTPARAGEMSKGVYARQLLGIPLERGLSVLVAERIADVAVMAALAVAGLLLLGRWGGFWQITLVAPVLLAVVAVALFGLSRVAGRGGGTGIAARVGRLAAPADESRRALLSPGAMGVNVGLGLTAWLIEVAMYFTALSALGQPADGHHLAIALAVFPLASLAGAVSLVPGGLGVTEGGLAALGVALGALAGEVSVISGLLTRAAILGVVVVAGLAATALAAGAVRPAWSAARPPGAAGARSGCPE